MADIKTDQDHTTSLKDLTKENKKHKPGLEEQRAETEALIDISKSRRKTIEGLITISDDLKVVDKDNLTAKKAVVDQVKGAGMSIVQGAEGFVTGMFGGPIGGIINTLSVGFLTRWLTNRKQEKEKQKDFEKKKEKEDELLDKRIAAMAKSALGAEFDAELFAEGNEAQKKLVEGKEAEIREQFDKREEAAKVDTEALETKKAQAFIEGKSAEEIETLGGEKKEEAEKNNGVVVPIVDDVDGEGEVTASEGMSLDTTNLLLTDIEGHLNFMTDNMEDAESRRERLRKLGAKKAGGKVDIKKEDDEGFSFMGLMGTIIGAISGALMGAVAGLTLGFIGMWKDIFKFIGGKLAKMFPNVTKTLSDIFGKGGKISKFFTSIKLFFTQNKAFKAISDMIDTVKGSITKALKPVKTAVTTLKTGFTTFFKDIKGAFKMISGPIDSIKKMLGVGAKAGAGGAGFLKGFKTFFKVFKGFFKLLFKPLQIIISLVEGFFEAKDAVNKSEGMMATFFNAIIGFFGGVLDGLIFGMLDLVKDGISWVAGFLGFEDVEKFLDSFSFSDMFNEFLDDIYKWFNLLFSDPLAALEGLWDGLTGGMASIMDFIWSPIKSGIAWVMRLFGFDDAAAATESFSIGGFISGVFTSIKEWFKSLFNFDSTSGIIASLVNVLTFLPNMIKDAIGAVTVWLLELFGFGDAAKGVADANKFSLGEMLMNTLTSVKNWFLGLFAWGKKAGATKDGFSISKLVTEAVDNISKWFSELFDSITNFDFAKFARGIMPDFLADMIFGKGESEVEKPAEAKKAEAAAQGGEAEKALEKPDTGGMFDAILNPFRTYVKDLLSDTTGIPEWVENIVLGAIPGGEVKDTSARGSIIKGRAAKGAIVTKPAYLPSSGTVVGEHASWSGKGAAGGGVPDGGSEAIIPLDGERGGAILAEALAPAIAGAILNELMMARVGGAGAEGGGSPITESSTPTSEDENLDYFKKLAEA